MPHIHVVSGSSAAARRLLDGITSGLAAKGYEDIRRQEAGDWVTLLSENSCRGIFEEKSAVVIEEGEKLGPFPKQLASMMEDSGASAHIILVCKSGNQQPIPKELADKCSFSKAETPPPWSRERDEIILEAVRNEGVGISKDAISLLKELFEDTGELASESEKLASFCVMLNKKEISSAIAGDYCMSDGSRSLLKLLDSLCSFKIRESLEALSELSVRGELPPLLSALHNRFRLAMYYAIYQDDRAGFSRALAVKDYAARLAASAAKIYGAKPLTDFVIGLIRIMSNERSGQSAGWFDLDVLVIGLLGAVNR